MVEEEDRISDRCHIAHADLELIAVHQPPELRLLGVSCLPRPGRTSVGSLHNSSL